MIQTVAKNIEDIIKRVKDNDKTLTEINLHNTKITTQNLTSLTTALAKNQFVQIFDFSNNFIGLSGVALITSALEKNKSLHTLYLRSNKVGDEGAKLFANLLKNKNDTLKNLYLGNNQITHIGAEALAETLSFNSTLEVLSFRNNSIGDTGCMTLEKNLEINASLKTLNLANTDITDKSLPSLLTLLELNTNLADIKLGFNEIKDSKTLDEIMKCLKYNSSQNTVAVNTIARKILIYCEKFLSEEELGAKRKISNEDLARKYGLSKEDFYYLSNRNSHGGAILCLSSLFRITLNKYNKETVDVILKTANILCPTLFSNARIEMSNHEIEKPHQRAVSMASTALDKVDTKQS
ncbi:MAG: hypothetical protein KGQ36_05705 [Rickettsiales bacterium]|nr:hypothetical protein [Rickettsiales bacterium]